MSAPRNRRLPISCEACRTRKIRCPRDGPPCSTCTRRGMNPDECEYARRRRPGSSSHQSARMQNVATVPKSPLSTPPATSTSPTKSSSDQQLAERVRRLEQLLQSQNGTSSTSGHMFVDGMAIDPSSRAAPSSLPLGCQEACPKSNTSGSLRTTASGHVRFMPQRMTWDSNSNLPDDTGSFDLRSGPLGSSADLHTLLAALPPTGICTELVRIYFSSFASLFHVLHDPSFWRQYELFVQDAESVRLEWLALLYTVLATAVIALTPNHPILSELSRKRSGSQKRMDLSERWRGMALRCLEADQYLWRHSLCTLQCLALMIYSIGHTHGQTWTLLGLSNHLAQSIGCHVDPEDFNISQVEKEERRRCWAALMMLYTNQNTTIGMIGPSRSRTSSSPNPPADVNDSDVEAIRPIPNSGGHRATQMTYLLLKFRLYDICAEISEKVLSKSEQSSMHMIRALDAAICDEQSSWGVRYPAGDGLQPHHAAHLNVLYSYSDHLALLLHRGVTPNDSVGNTMRCWSQARQLESAKRLIRTHSALEDDPDLEPFRWYNRGLGSFHAFHAAIVLFSLLRIDATVQEVRERYQLFQDCLGRLRDLSDSNPMCAKAAAILQRLVQSETSRSSQVDLMMPDVHAPRESRTHRVREEQREHTTALPPLMPEQADSVDWSAMFDTIESQQWLTPTGFPWEHWNFVLDNPGMAANC